MAVRQQLETQSNQRAKMRQGPSPTTRPLTSKRLRARAAPSARHPSAVSAVAAAERGAAQR
eukprot:3024254-Pleurochrysis_carterae.AAC.1